MKTPEPPLVFSLIFTLLLRNSSDGNEAMVFSVEDKVVIKSLYELKG